MAIIQIQGFKCEVCGHIWIYQKKQSKQSPIACPKCKSPDWNKFQGKKHNLFWIFLAIVVVPAFGNFNNNMICKCL